MMAKCFLIFSFFVLLSGCHATYSQSKNELVNPGHDYVLWEFYSSKTLQVYENEQLKNDLNECVESLKEKFGKPENLVIGQEQIRKCMKAKDWSLLEEVQVS